MEHLLRDVNDPTVSTLASQIKHKMSGLSSLRERLSETRRAGVATRIYGSPSPRFVTYRSFQRTRDGHAALQNTLKRQTWNILRSAGARTWRRSWPRSCR